MSVMIHEPGDLPSALSPIRRARRLAEQISLFVVAQAFAMQWRARMEKENILIDKGNTAFQPRGWIYASWCGRTCLSSHIFKDRVHNEQNTRPWNH
jgi:hypothetical protein